MFENFIRFLIFIACVAACYFLAIWVMGELGIVLPHMVLVCIMVIAVLIIILTAWRMFGSVLSGSWFGPPK
jgi:hypothetical protein